MGLTTSGLRPILELPLRGADARAVSFVAGVPLDILIVDDSTYIRAFVRIHLQEAGYEVGEVEPASLYDVLAALHAHRPALVITDYEMPACNGESLLRAIREDATLQDTPVIVLSAHREADLVARLGRWGLVAYVLKPIRPEELVEKVKQFFQTRDRRAGPEPGSPG
jgi:DNA-binding response OmpR family regulator